jgi:hypothetical protein
MPDLKQKQTKNLNFKEFYFQRLTFSKQPAMFYVISD